MQVRFAFLKAILLLATMLGCAISNNASSEKFITDGDLSHFGIRGVNKIGDWYHFQRGNALVRVKINKIGLHYAFGNTLYFNEITIIYPADWKIRVVRVENEFYFVSADTKRGEDSVSFFVNLIGPSFIANDGREWQVERDRETKEIHVRFWPKNLYDQFYAKSLGDK